MYLLFDTSHVCREFHFETSLENATRRSHYAGCSYEYESPCIGKIVRYKAVPSGVEDAGIDPQADDTSGVQDPDDVYTTGLVAGQSVANSNAQQTPVSFDCIVAMTGVLDMENQKGSVPPSLVTIGRGVSRDMRQNPIIH